MERFMIVTVVLFVGFIASSMVYADKKIDFGDPNFPAPMDSRNHVLIPNEVTVKVGETVRFQVHGFHQVLVYEVPQGTTLDDVNIDAISITVNGTLILNTDEFDPVHSPTRMALP